MLSGRCDEHATLTYQPFIESFDHYVRHVSDEDLHGLITQCGPEVAAFLPTLSRRASVPSSVVSADPEASRYLLYSSITALIGAIARRRPVVLILEDLHWADAASIDLLRYLGDHIDAERIMVLITYRDSVVHREHPLSSAIGDLHRRGGVMQLRLEGLDGPAVTSLVESSAGHPLDADGVALASALADETQGNPFFIREVLRHLVDVGSLVNDDGRWRPRSTTDAIVVPDSVRQVIDSRIDHLGQDCRRALELGAVIGREFELALMKLVLDTDELSLLELLEHPVQAGILREVAGDRYRFHHALIQHALYDGLAGGRRTRLHRRVAEAYEADPAQRPGSRTAELARHWAASDDPENMRRAVRYAREAGEASMAQLAPRDACTYFAEALATLDRIPTSDRGERLDLAIQLGTAQRELGDPAFKATLIAAALDALDLDDTPRLVRSVLAADRGTYTTIGRVDDDRVNTVRAALQRLGDSHATDSARLLAILANELTWVTPIDERIELATRAVTLARASGDPETVVRVASLVCFAIQVPETLDLRLDFSADALTHARALGDPLLLHWAAATRSITAVHAGLADELDEDFELIEATAARLTTPTVSWQAKLRAASRALILGQPERAEALAVEARDFGVTHGHPEAAVVFAPQIAVTRWQQGRMRELIPLLSDTIAHTSTMPVFTAVLAVAHSEEEQIAAASQLLRDAKRNRFELPRDNTWLSGMTCWATVANACDDADAANILTAVLRPFERQCCYDRVTSTGFIAHYLGTLAATLGRRDEAAGHFASALASAERMGATWAMAITCLEWGRLRLTHQATADSRQTTDLLQRAAALAHNNGYATISRRTAELLV